MKNPLSFLRRKDNILAFGAELSSCKYRLTLARYQSMGEFIRREAQERSTPLQLLDIGCGEGRLIFYGPYPQTELTGTDVSLSSVRLARERGYKMVVQSHLAAGLPWNDQSFDIVVCSHILEHLQRPENMVAEATRVLRPGGLFIVGVPVCLSLTRWLRIHLVPRMFPKKRPEVLAARFGHVQFFTLPSLEALLSYYKIEDVRGFRFLSAGSYLPLENWRWYYCLNAAWGRTFPRLTSEVNVIARKPSLPQRQAPIPSGVS